MTQYTEQSPAPDQPIPGYAIPIAPLRGGFTVRDVLSAVGPLLGLICIFALFAVLQPRTFLAADNLQIILLDTAVVGTAALGATVIIISGGIDLSVGSNIAVCTVVVATMLVHGFSPLFAAATGVFASCVCGLIMGLLITRLNLISFIVTLGMLGALRGAAESFAGETEIYPPTQTWLVNLLDVRHTFLFLPAGVWMLLGLTLAVAAVLRYTRFGRHVFAIGSNEQTARLCGIRVENTKLLIYIFGTLFAGLAGVLQFSRLTMGDPTTANGYELNVIAAVVIGGASLNGGQGSVFGTLVGALLMTTIGNGCNKVGLSTSAQMMVTGGIIIAAAALDKLRHRRVG
jgi:ribose transport system permease protein